VDVHTDIFSFANHKRALLSVGVVVCTQTLLQKGRPFILRPAVIGNVSRRDVGYPAPPHRAARAAFLHAALTADI